MREILFRGKRSYNQNWVFGNLVIDRYGKFHIVQIEDVYMDGHHVSIDSDIPAFFEQDSISQYTGYKDKNGNRIFGGDIVESGTCVGVIAFENGAFIVKRSDIKYSHKAVILKQAVWSVIGNIHDNPELLEGKE